MYIDTHCHVIKSEYNNVEEIIKKLENKRVFLSSVTDCYNPLEKDYKITILTWVFLSEYNAIIIRGKGKYICRYIYYRIYIYHMTVVNAMLAVGMRGKPVYLIIVLAGTLVLAYLSSIFMERIVKRPPSLYRTSQLRGGNSTSRL